MTPELTPAQLKSLSTASQHLAAFGLKEPVKRLQTITAALVGVCQLGASTPERADLIRSAVGPEQDVRVRVKCLNWIARNVKHLAKSNPMLAAEIYRTALAHPVESNEPVPLVDSPIMPMTSTLRQDYQSALRHLGEEFGHLLGCSAEHALPLLCEVLTNWGTDRCPPRGAVPRTTFTLLGHATEFRADGSSIWDSNDVYDHECPLMMLTAFEAQVGELANNVKSTSALLDLVAGVARCNPPAVIWRRLLRLAVSHPTTLGVALVPLLASTQILATPDTNDPARKCLAAVFPLLGPQERRSIEDAILGLPSLDVLRDDKKRFRKRDRLLACLPSEYLVTEGAKTLRSEVKPDEHDDEDHSSIRVSPMSAEDIERHFAERRGAQFDDPTNVALRTILTPLDALNSQLRNAVPSNEEAGAMVAEMVRVREALAQERGAHQEYVDQALGALASASAIILRNESTIGIAGWRELVIGSLLEASRSEVPRHREDSNSSFDKNISWGGGLPRIEAAQGLMRLARYPEGATPQVLGAIDRLSRDPVSSIRFFVAEQLRALYKTANDQMWEMAERLAADSSYAVADAVVRNFLHPLLRLHKARVLGIVTGVFERFPFADVQRNPKEACLDLYLGGYLHLNEDSAREFLFALCKDIAARLAECRAIVHGIRNSLVANKQANKSGDDESEDRQRAWTLLNAILREAIREWQALNSEYGNTPSSQIPRTATEKWESLALLLDSAATELYFASGAYDEKQHVKGVAGDDAPSEVAKDLFWKESRESLEILEPVVLAPAVHHLVELLYAFIDKDPATVFRRIGNVVCAAEAGGYPSDSLAADLIVKIVNRYLAEYRHVLRNDEECRNLMIRVLDIFVSWPQARRLVYRLEEIYR